MHPAVFPHENNSISQLLTDGQSLSSQSQRRSATVLQLYQPFPNSEPPGTVSRVWTKQDEHCYDKDRAKKTIITVVKLTNASTSFLVVNFYGVQGHMQLPLLFFSLHPSHYCKFHLTGICLPILLTTGTRQTRHFVDVPVYPRDRVADYELLAVARCHRPTKQVYIILHVAAKEYQTL